jgi:hypothetical protein
MRINALLLLLLICSFIKLLKETGEVKAVSVIPPIDGQFMPSPTKYRFKNSENLTAGLESIPIPFFG